MNPNEIEEQLQRILASRAFRSSARMSRFLRFTVTEMVAGNGDLLKEAVVGMEVFDRSHSYDPRIDPIVRVEARRLRQKLAQYYATEGRTDPIVVTVPKGAYVPQISARGGAARTAEPRSSQRSIVVLPFSNLSPEPGGDYFSDGLTQELIHALTRVHGLRVLAWRSAAHLRGKSHEDADVGRSTSADVILEGAVRRQGDRVRVNAQLVEAQTGAYLWTESYDRELHDLFALQEEIAQAVAAVLEVKLAAAAPAPRGYSVEAHDFYLRGRYEWWRRTPISIRSSIALFERAIEADRQCASAYAGLADAYSVLADYGLEQASDAMPKARRAAQKALEIDPTLAEAHSSLGFILSVFDWKWDDAEAHYRKAIEMNPGYVTAHHWYSIDYLMLRGRFEEAAHHIAIACQLDPLEPIIVEGPAYLSLIRRDTGRAIQLYEGLLRSAPQFPKSYTGLGRAYWLAGRPKEAVELLERGRSLAGDMPSILGALGQVRCDLGEREEARRLLARLREMAQRQFVAASCFALIHTGLGEITDALDWLEHGAERRDTPISQLNVHPAYDRLRGEPRFQRLLERIHLA